MRKVITTVIMIFVILALIGACDDCDGCDSGCGSSCETSSCESKYEGEITLKIHTYNDSVITAKGDRDSNNSKNIVKYNGQYHTFGEYVPTKRTGYTFGGLYYKIGSQYNYIMSGEEYGYNIDYDELYKIKNKEVLDVYESWNAINYSVKYVANEMDTYYIIYDYYVGSVIELSQNVENVFNRNTSSRKQVIGYTAYYYDKNNELVEFDWAFGGSFNETLISHFENMNYTNGGIITVKQKLLADKVKVELNFLYSDENGNQIPSKTIQVGYDEDLAKYFSEGVTAKNVEFMGWYLDVSLTQVAPKEISKQYENTPLQLYAKHKEFKSIKVNLQNGNPAVDARIYSDGTLSIDVENGNFYGLSNTTDMKRLPYSAIVDGETYYATYFN